MAAARVLVVDDDRSIRRTLEKLLQGEGYDVTTAADGHEAQAAFSAADLVLLDLGLPGVDGLTVLETIHACAQPPPVVVLTARDDMQSTVKAVQLGAYDYLIKPPDIDRLKLVLRRALESREATRALDAFVTQASDSYQVGNIIGKSTAIREIYKAIGAVSVGRASVLIQGESGTGKELVARAIHYSSADRARPFTAVNCTAFARDLLESELFGHVRGAFTGAVADKVGRFELAGAGTLFLDEVAEIPIDLQAKLLRVLQERTFERVGDTRSLPLKARIVAATHRDLEAMAREGTFREDLLYRLKVVEIAIPPLRDRPEDIPLLVETLLGKINRELHKSVRYVSREAMALLAAYRWPGNVRELENMLTRAVVLAKSDMLEPSLLPILASEPPPPAAAAAAAAHEDEAVLPLRVVEQRAIERALRATGWNKRRACALLEISRPTLDRKIEEYGLKREAES
jgi:DNA-binding NtrC family response regulator